MLVEPGKTALLVVDVLEATVEGREADPALDAFASACTEVVGACRACGIPVIFLDDAHVPGLDRELELWGEHGIAGSAGARPAACLGPCDRDLVIEKGRYSGFFQTDLDLTLRELGCDRVVAIGFDSNICVLHTLADAYFLGYDSLVVADACRSTLVGSEAGALEYFRRCYGSDVVSLDEFRERLAGDIPA